MNNTKLETIQFHNQSLIVLNHENKPYIAIKPICENIGLDWEAQRQRIKRNEILNSTACMIKVVAKDGKNREVLCLPLGYLNGWLAGIELSRVNPQIKPLLKQYQLECFDVLYNHFMPKVASQYPNTISIEQQQAIKQAVNERSYRTGEHYQAIYSKFYEQFKVPRYQDLPASKFDEAIQWLGGIHSRNGLSEKDLYLLARLYCITVRMHHFVSLISPALDALVSKYADSFHSMAFHYQREINDARLVIERETMHIKPKDVIDDWNRVLPTIRLKLNSK